MDTSKRRYMFVKQILKPKYDEDKNFRRDICPRSDGSYRLRSEQEHAERYQSRAARALRDDPATAGAPRLLTLYYQLGKDDAEHSLLT